MCGYRWRRTTSGEYDLDAKRASNSGHSSLSGGEDLLPPLDTSGEHANQLNPCHEAYDEWSNKRKKKRDSLIITGIDTNDDEEDAMVGEKPLGVVPPRVSDQVIMHQRAELEEREDKSPVPHQRVELGDVGEAVDDDARGTSEPRGACATRPSESMEGSDEPEPSIAADALNDKLPAPQQRHKLGYLCSNEWRHQPVRPWSNPYVDKVRLLEFDKIFEPVSKPDAPTEQRELGVSPTICAW